MANWRLKTPVCFIIYRRPDTTEKVFELIRQAKPPKLLVVADGPRSNQPDEIEKCAATRAIIERVDWECEVLKNYSDVNLGCKLRVASGLDWVFNTVEKAIILEDDCLPHPTFFRFCEELLDYHQDDERIMTITGNNFQFGRRRSEYSYYFSIHTSIWGWATWRRAWQHYDVEIKLWPKLRDSHWLENILQDTEAVKCWKKIFQYAYSGYTAWDYAWTFSCWVQNSLSIVPNINLVSNIDCNPEKNGVVFAGLFGSMPVEAIHFTLQHPPAVIRDAEADKLTQSLLHNLYWQNHSSFLEVRKQVTEFLITLPEDYFKSIYLKENIKRLINSGVRHKPLSVKEKNVMNEIVLQMSREVNDSKIIQYLLAVMLYRHAHQLPLLYDLTQIPEWLLNDYLKFLFDFPKLFQEIGEADSYYKYMQGWVNYIHTNMCSSPSSKLMQDVVSFFTRNANFIPVYFNNANLKDIYKKRADLLEFALQMDDHQIDYDFSERSPGRKKIRLGILAAHFAPQTETFTTLPVYKHLNRDLFEIILYAVKGSNHRLERYCSGHADAFITLPQDLPSQVQTIRDGDLDIILIATNVTAVTNSTSLLALHRLARIQAANTSSCVTTGMRHVDYYISGELTEPENNAQQHYTETLVTINGPAHCNDFGTEEQLVSTISVSRESLGIAQNAVVYMSGANFFKIIPEVETAWAKIIAKVPNSKLVLYPFNPNWSSSYPVSSFKKRIVTTFASYGLSEDRLIILETVPNRADVRERLKLGDVYLDSYPFSGVYSLIDPLELGLPPVVMEGNSFRTLMGPALLRELQIPDLIADNEDSYINLALALGTNPELRKQKSDQIKQKMQANPRFLDSRSYSAQMGALFQELFRKHQAIALTDSLKLRDINLIIFPDWSQPEDLLYQELASVITRLVDHPDKSQITLLIHRSNLSEDDANLFLSDVVMNLLLEEDLDVADGPEISLVGQLGEMQWEALLPQIRAWIVLENENQQAMPTAWTTAAVKAENIPSYEIDGLSKLTSISI